MQSEVFQSHSVEETERIAGRLARTLPAGTCIALEGDLGAGKTQFVRGMVAGLGGNPRQVASPTFILIRRYDIDGKSAARAPTHVFHLDAYRVAGEQEMEDIGFQELLAQEGIVVVEWASRVAALLPRGHIQVHLRAVGESAREIRIGRNG